MSQNSRKEQSANGDISRTATEGDYRKENVGFEGMNFEQFRQPFDPNYTGRNRTNDDRNHIKRPDEA